MENLRKKISDRGKLLIPEIIETGNNGGYNTLQPNFTVI